MQDEPKSVILPVIQSNEKRDYGCQPISVNKFRMIPSGDIVDIKERNRRFNL